ncbi:MAG: hypothetical protein AABN95_15210 [Acidobacteriota bacterium]
MSFSEEFLRDRYEKESDFHFNSLLSGDGVPELRSELYQDSGKPFTRLRARTSLEV